MSTTPVTRRVKAIAAVCAFGLLAAACGDDDDDTEASAPEESSTSAPEGEAAGSEYQEYCDAVTAMGEAEEFDPANFERIRDAAPDEIRSEVDVVADAFIAAEGDYGKVLADPAVEEPFAAIQEFEAEHCAGGGGEVDPEFAEYCDQAAALDEQDEPPTVEQLEELRALAPEEISEEVGVVADAVAAADGDFGKVMSDPAVEEAFGAIEPFEEAHCGREEDGGGEEGEEDLATEPIEGAQVIPVTAVDFAFEGVPAEVPAGAVSFEFTNGGDAAHEMAVFKLGEGVQLADLLASEEEPSDEEAQEVGFTFAGPGEGGVYLNAEDLTAGTYAVVCFIPGPEGKAHHELGMQTTFTVG